MRKLFNYIKKNTAYTYLVLALIIAYSVIAKDSYLLIATIGFVFIGIALEIRNYTESNIQQKSFELLSESIKRLSNTPICPECHSTDTMKIEDGKYMCKNCNTLIEKE